MKRPIKLLERCNGDFSFDADGGDIWDEREIENLKVGVVFGEKNSDAAIQFGQSSSRAC